MAKFPSIQSVFLATQKTIFRFPLETIITVIGTIYCIILSEEKNNSVENFYIKIVWSCALCLVLFLSISLFFLATKKSKWIRFLISLLLGSLIFTFVFSFSERITEIEIKQLLVLNIALHLLVSFAGFIPISYNENRFWEFNKQLFIRILTSGLYSFVLYSGLALAILAITNLFNVKFYDNIYIHLFFVIAGVFNTMFFLNGVPETNNSTNPLTLSYPLELKKFTQYVLLPLISIYLAILICYELKIVVTQTLPVGWVSNLVLVFALFGILSFLLIHPISGEKGNLWIQTFSRWFYYLLVPLLALLFWAILYRINLYGFTHERYYVLILSIWLTIVVAYFIFNKHPRIKFIPISMCLTALFTIIGPQSASAVSKNSQLSRFENYINNKRKLTFEQEKDLSSIVDFLENNYGVEALLPFAKNKLDALLKKDKNPSTSQIMNALGYKYRYRYATVIEDEEDFNYNYYNNNDTRIDNIHGYDMSFSIRKNAELNCNDCILVNNISYSVASIEKDYGQDLIINKTIIPLKITAFVNGNPAFDVSSQNEIIQIVETPKYQISITYINVSGKKEVKTIALESYSLDVMLKIKN